MGGCTPNWCLLELVVARAFALSCCLGVQPIVGGSGVWVCGATRAADIVQRVGTRYLTPPLAIAVGAGASRGRLTAWIHDGEIDNLSERRAEMPIDSDSSVAQHLVRLPPPRVPFVYWGAASRGQCTFQKPGWRPHV
eukprot:COSAG02_NODE_5559_length_4229_cov_143.642373_2_plen_137_part_00